jgi:ferredoxin
MDVTVLTERCVGQGMCVLYAPDAFIQSDEDGCAQARFRHVPKDQEDAVRRAADACPEQAIIITEQAGA